jgi:hypothetical protein
MLLAAVLAYTVHLVQIPAGWLMAQPLQTSGTPDRPAFAAIARNGTIAVLLQPASNGFHVSQRLLIVRANGTSTILREQSRTATHAFRRFLGPSECMTDNRDCPSFENVALARDGTPFVTLAYHFSGAYSGVGKAALVWNGAWHAVPSGKPFNGVGKPDDPDSLSIAAADTATSFAFIGDYLDSFPTEDLLVAARDPQYMADVSGVEHESRNLALGLGHATAMRGPFVAGFYEMKGGPPPTTAIIWRCALSIATLHPCTRYNLGPGIAYGVNSRGDIVGDDEPFLNNELPPRERGGSPVLWRDGKKFRLSTGRGSAYAISESGTIVGVSDSGGFIANALDANPRARPLDELIASHSGGHVQTALGVADNDNILALVVGMHGEPELALLVRWRT